MKPLIAETLTLLILAIPAAPLRADPAAPDVLAVAPANAWGVVCIRQLGEMDQKLNTLIQQANLPIPFQNPISTLGLSQLGFISGVNQAGGLGLVILPTPSFQAMGDRTVLLIPTTDMAELVSLIEPEDVEAGISKGILQGKEVFIAQKSGHGLFSPSLDAIKAVLNSAASVRSKLNAHQAKHYEKDDIVIWLNAEAITAADAFKAMLPMLQMVNVDPDMLTQLRTLILSVRITPAGIRFGLYTDHIPGTDAYRAMSSQAGTAESLLVGLPKDRYILGFGQLSGKQASEMGAEMLAKALNNPQLQALELDPTKLEQIKNMVVSRVKLLRTLSVSISGLPEGPDGLVSLAKVVGMEGDPKQGLAMFAELVGIIKGGLIPQEEATAMLSALEYTRGAETIGDLSVDHLSFDVTKLGGEENAAEAQEWLGMISKIVGKDGILFRMGVVDAKHIVMTFGGGAERFKTVAALVQEKKAPLAEDEGIQRSRTHLPSMRSAEAYFAVDQLLNLIGTISRAVDAPMPPMSLGELNAPIAFATQPIEKGGSQSELFIPMELTIAVKDLAMGMMSGAGAPVAHDADSRSPRSGDAAPAEKAGP